MDDSFYQVDFLILEPETLKFLEKSSFDFL